MQKPDFIIAQVFKTDAVSLLLPFGFCLLPFTGGDRWIHCGKTYVTAFGR